MLLLEANTNELSVTSNGISLAYNSADGHFRMNRYLLRLSLNADARTGGRIDCYSGGPSAAIIGSHS